MGKEQLKFEGNPSNRFWDNYTATQTMDMTDDRWMMAKSPNPHTMTSADAVGVEAVGSEIIILPHRQWMMDDRCMMAKFPYYDLCWRSQAELKIQEYR